MLKLKYPIMTELDTLTDKMLVLEESVDDVEEGITDLQVVNNDILDRLTVLEDAVISKILLSDLSNVQVECISNNKQHVNNLIFITNRLRRVYSCDRNY